VSDDALPAPHALIFDDMTLLPVHQTHRVGDLTVHALQAGLQQLDGGAMFGVVPKTLWERKIAADDRNRIPLGMRCLLIEHPDGLVLIDTGVGDKESDKFRSIYGIENSPVGSTGSRVRSGRRDSASTT
jgi:hypothetical protein